MDKRNNIMIAAKIDACDSLSYLSPLLLAPPEQNEKYCRVFFSKYIPKVIYLKIIIICGYITSSNKTKNSTEI